jgi:hypothetical protein
MKVETAVCASCQGTGKCSRCSGTGSRHSNLPGPSAVSEKIRSDSAGASRKCVECLGTGTCQTCLGSGNR